MAYLVVQLLTLSAMVVVSQSKLVIDHDGGSDDAIAIFEALIYEQYFNGPQVLALTTTHGNVPEPQAFINTQRFLDVAGRRDIPIYRGSNYSLVIDEPSDSFFGSDGLGNSTQPVKPIRPQPEHAALALIDLTKRYPGEITVVALGVFTNLALAIHLDPGFLGRLKNLYLAVGHDEGTPKYNVFVDVEAYRVVMRAARPDKVTIVYYNKAINITTDWRKNVLGRLNTTTIRALNEYERISLTSSEQVVSWTLLDPAVMAAFLDDSVVGEVKYANNTVTLCGEQRGMLEINYTTEQKANVRVIRELDSKNYKNALYSIFAAETKLYW